VTALCGFTLSGQLPLKCRR